MKAGQLRQQVDSAFRKLFLPGRVAGRVANQQVVERGWRTVGLRVHSPTCLQGRNDHAAAAAAAAGAHLHSCICLPPLPRPIRPSLESTAPPPSCVVWAVEGSAVVPDIRSPEAGCWAPCPHPTQPRGRGQAPQPDNLMNCINSRALPPHLDALKPGQLHARHVVLAGPHLD